MRGPKAGGKLVSLRKQKKVEEGCVNSGLWALQTAVRFLRETSCEKWETLMGSAWWGRRDGDMSDLLVGW